ncbi:MAG: SAM-dependent methyltransferase [Ktedonobacteraceae bacterium]|nr:SAM-dependent methyltransferase [Ktedonobacteraceae bacterium]
MSKALIKPEELIENPLDVARFVASQRAQESARPDALIHDPLALQLAGERGEALMRSYRQDRADARGIGLRTRVHDEIITHLIEQEQLDAVICLGTRFDTRPYRLTLSAQLRWIEADLPEIIAYKEENLSGETPSCLLERVALDVTDAEAREVFFAETCAGVRKALLITEGLLAYLTEAQVSTLSQDLYAQEKIGWWLMEMITPVSLRNQANVWNELVSECAQLRFAPLNGCSFFTEHGWEVAEFRSLVAEALRLELPLRRKWLVRLLVRLNRHNINHTDGFVLFKHA